MQEMTARITVKYKNDRNDRKNEKNKSCFILAVH